MEPHETRRVEPRPAPKRRRAGAAAAIAGLWVLCACTAMPPLRLRVLSFNIHHGEGGDGRLDLERIAAVIRQAAPDLVALQEVDQGARRSGGVDMPAELGRRTGLTPVFGPNIALEGGRYGNCALARLAVKAARNELLPIVGVTGAEQRGALVLELVAPALMPDAEEDGEEAGSPLRPERALRFVATHFDHRGADAERLASAARLEALLDDSAETPTILAGDLNAVPTSPTLAALGGSFQSATAKAALATIPAGQPRRQIDYILFRPAARWRVVTVEVLDEPLASDHRPILAVLELRP